jgi:hypothetical protein
VGEPDPDVDRSLFRIFLFALMIGQTVHILNGSERRYINLRHLLIKWIFLFITFLLADHIKKHTSHDELFVLMCSLFALAMVYPSKVTTLILSSSKTFISPTSPSAKGKETTRLETTWHNSRCPSRPGFYPQSPYSSSTRVGSSSPSSTLNTARRLRRP